MSSLKSAHPKVSSLPSTPLSPSKPLEAAGPTAWCLLVFHSQECRCHSFSVAPPPPLLHLAQFPDFPDHLSCSSFCPTSALPGTSCLVALQEYSQGPPTQPRPSPIPICSLWTPSLSLLFLHLNSALGIGATVPRIPRPEIWVSFRIPPHSFHLGPTAKGQ